MANKTEYLAVKLTVKELQYLRKCAKEQDIKVPEYVRDALDFYGAFNVHFLEHMGSIAEKLKIPVVIAIQNLLTVYIATESAALEAYGTTPTIYKRAFQYSKKGEMLTGNKLSLLAFDQATANLKKLKEEFEQSVKTGKPARITLENAAFVADHREAGKEHPELVAAQG